MKTKIKHRGLIYDLSNESELDRLLSVLEKEISNPNEKPDWQFQALVGISYFAILLIVTFGMFKMAPDLMEYVELIGFLLFIASLLLYLGFTLLIDHLWFMKLERKIKLVKKCEPAGGSYRDNAR